ncbi:hypothetical protein GCN74_03510 [Janthinobacterium sp. FT14W]|uniref:hypothetical protein n=1 Tax=Janthinobacterium sp. FT14W TaxID=2654253 RepID=UPI0012652122|nr:hypothetical protein [Janthinobacterium sp. FT14W]KAB8062104.1 hypothetical protein GCN74_03510 [Janthinobacterium sp. FT14W]
MQKIQHPSNNGVLGAPAGWDQAELPCNALPITCTHVGDLPAVLSYWRLDAGELAALNAGGAVRLWGAQQWRPLWLMWTRIWS